MTITLDDVLAEAQKNHGGYPKPRKWQELCELLPERRRKGSVWVPSLPLILVVWPTSPALPKRRRPRMMRIFEQQHISGWWRGQKLRGNPDFTFRKERLCVFVDDCFWHGCPRCYRLPVSNHDYSPAKVERNRVGDKLVDRALRRDRWSAMRLWEHELSDRRRASLLRRIRRTGLQTALLAENTK